MKHTNYGIDWEKEKLDRSETDWVFGASEIKSLVSIPRKDRLFYLPKGEVQQGREDTMDCASRGPLNILETDFNWLLRNKKLLPANEKWLRDNGYVVNDMVEFSDAFIAILSGTTRQGNSLKAPLEAIRLNGLIPKSMLPLNPDMTWEEYHDPQRITPRMRGLGEEFKQRFTINYQIVYEKDYEELLEKDLLNVAGYAWPEPVNGEYPRSNNTPNHCFIVFANPLYYAFDNYTDWDNDFIKKLAPDYDMVDYGYRVCVSGQVIPRKVNWFIDLLIRFGIIKA